MAFRSRLIARGRWFSIGLRINVGRKSSASLWSVNDPIGSDTATETHVPWPDAKPLGAHS